MAQLGWASTQEALVASLRSLGGMLWHAPLKDQAAIAWQWYVAADPLAGAVAVALLASAVVFLLSLPTNQHSWVDKTWSLLPIFYAWHFALHDHLMFTTESPNPRLLAVAVLVTIWGVRLTWNFYRKGGYSLHGEDYRWPVIRSKIHPVLFQLFNLFFIAVYQNLLLAAIVAPAYVAWQHRSMSFGPLDGAATVSTFFFLVFEFVADEQQWAFQSAKHARLAAGKRLTGEYAKGFLTKGLWKFSRHPNFFAEQSIWWSVYLFSVSATGHWLHWSIAGAINLTLLFQAAGSSLAPNLRPGTAGLNLILEVAAAIWLVQGSTWLTERISTAKYGPKYDQYKQTTSRLIPWFPSAPPQRAKKRTTASAAPDEVPRPAPAASGAAPVEAASPAPGPTPVSRRRAARTPRPTSAAEAEAETPAVHTRSRLRTKAAAA